MSTETRENYWDNRYAASDEYVFGERPNAFLAAEVHRIAPGSSVLAVADGEGRNGVFLAGQGAVVHSVDASPAAIAKAARLAASRGVALTLDQVDLTAWTWPVTAYDAVVAIFIQFSTAAERPAVFANLKRALKPGGLLLLEGYRVEQLRYGTGGPREATQLYTEAMLREAFADMTILALRAYDAVIEEGSGHSGMSALIDLIAVREG